VRGGKPFSFPFFGGKKSLVFAPIFRGGGGKKKKKTPPSTQMGVDAGSPGKPPRPKEIFFSPQKPRLGGTWGPGFWGVFFFFFGPAFPFFPGGGGPGPGTTKKKTKPPHWGPQKPRFFFFPRGGGGGGAGARGGGGGEWPVFSFFGCGRAKGIICGGWIFFLLSIVFVGFRAPPVFGRFWCA